MSKYKKYKSKPFQNSEKKEKKGLKVECCEKYLKKGEEKRCKRCPCLDMGESQRIERFVGLEIDY